jgi:hypothetical protein
MFRAMAGSIGFVYEWAMNRFAAEFHKQRPAEKAAWFIHGAMFGRLNPPLSRSPCRRPR